MANHAISLTDGTTTVTLNTGGGSNAVIDYEQSVPDSGSGDIENEPKITETLTVMLIAASGPLLQTAIRSVELLLVAAKRRQKKQTGARVYLQLQVDGEASTWRAEIVDGDFKPDTDMLKIGWPNLKAQGALMVTHRVWEGPETELQLSTSNAAAATGGRTIYNHDDAGTGHDNWVQIASTQVGGVLPTPVKLVMTNSTGSGIDTRNFFLATNALSDPANFVHILEGEARVSGFGTITADALDSGGNYNNYTFTTTGFMNWDLTAAQMQRTQGRRFRILARFHGWSGASLYIKPTLKDSTGTITFKEGDEILMGSSGSQIVDLGALPLPNGGYQVAWGAMVLSLVVRCTGAGIVNLDFMQLTPLDAYQQVAQRGLTLANGNVITFDNIEGLVYESVSGPIFTPLSGPLKVFPGLTQKIIILNDEGGSSNISRTFSVRAYIRERRLTV